MKWMFRFGLVLVALYVVGLLLIFTQQRKMMYFPPAGYLNPAGVNLPAAIEVPLRTETGIDLVGWWLSPKDRGPVILFFHGNGSAVYSNHDIYQDLSAKGYGVFGAAYPGYPGSGGEASERAIVEAVQVQYDYLIEQGIPEDNIVFYGTSLGAGVAAQLSQTRKPALLIMEAPFTSALDMGKRQMKIFPVSLLMKDKFLSADAIAGSDIPLIWLHGTSDMIIPFTMGQALYDGYDGPKAAHVIDGGGHNNLWYLGGKEIILEALASE